MQVPYEEFEVEKICELQAPSDAQRGVYSCIRKRALVGGGPCAYGQTIIEDIQPESPRGGGSNGVGGGKVQQLQLKRLLTRREYEARKRRADPERQVVTQRRASFLFENRYYSVTRYTSPPALAGLAVLYCQLRGDDEDEEGDIAQEGAPPKIALPPFLSIGREVTDQRAFSCHQLSRKTA